MKHYKDDSGVEHIDIDQTLTGGIKGTSENRTLDWTERPNNDHVFGDVSKLRTYCLLAHKLTRIGAIVSKSHRIDPDELSGRR